MSSCGITRHNELISRWRIILKSCVQVTILWKWILSKYVQYLNCLFVLQWRVVECFWLLLLTMINLNPLTRGLRLIMVKSSSGLGAGDFSKLVVTFNHVGGSFCDHHRGCLNNPIFSNLGLCAACWAHFMCHHELWPISVSHPSFYNNKST